MEERADAGPGNFHRGAARGAVSPRAHPAMRTWRNDPIVGRCAPFAAFITLLVLGSMIAIPGTAVTRNLIVVAFLIWFWPAYGDLRKPEPAAAFSWLLAVVVGVAVFVVWIWLDHDWAVFSRLSSGFDPRGTDGHIDWGVALARL